MDWAGLEIKSVFSGIDPFKITYYIYSRLLLPVIVTLAP